jgi:hypothetical protein
MLHEILHTDSLSNIMNWRFTLEIGIRYVSDFDPHIKKYQSCGPVRTRVLDLLPDTNVGEFIVINGKSILIQ